MAKSHSYLIDVPNLDSLMPSEVMDDLQQVEALYQEIPKQQVDFQLKGLTTAIARQKQNFEYTNIAQLNFQDPLEAKIAGDFLSSLFPDPKRSRLGIMELFMNAIEHGNLGISYLEKQELLLEGHLLYEISTRLQTKENKEKRVHVNCIKTDHYVQITIRDDGKGFDWRPYIKNTSELTNTKRLNGRGIVVANNIAFDELAYNEAGNVAQALQYIKQ